jgi:hypothetical protein
LEEVRGHELFLSDPKPVINYNGLFGMFVFEYKKKHKD